MKTCSNTCEPYCDFCMNYREYYEQEELDERAIIAAGYCLALFEVMSFDCGSGCDDFYCRAAWRIENAANGELSMNGEPIQAIKTSRRDLKGFAGGIANMFACSAQHYAWLAHHHGISHVEIDLFTLQIKPEQFDIKRNRILAGYCRSTLLRNIEKLKPPATAVSAILTADFGIDDFKQGEYSNDSIGETVYCVTLTDDRGKKWVAKITDKRVLAQD